MSLYDGKIYPAGIVPQINRSRHENGAVNNDVIDLFSKVAKTIILEGTCFHFVIFNRRLARNTDAKYAEVLRRASAREVLKVTSVPEFLIRP